MPNGNSYLINSDSFVTMESLINYLLQFGHLNQQQIDLVKSKGVVQEMKKDTYYQEAGKIPREVIFLTEGIFRICYYNNKGSDCILIKSKFHVRLYPSVPGCGFEAKDLLRELKFIISQ